MKNYIYGIIIFSGLVLLCFLLFTNKPILEVGEILVNEEDVNRANDVLGNMSTKEQKLAFILEDKLWKQFLNEFNIDSSDDAKLLYFENNHPNVISKESFENLASFEKNLLDAFKDIKNNKLNKNEVFEKYLSNQMSLDKWMAILKTIDIDEMIKTYKENGMNSYESYVKETLLFLDDNYIKETVRNKICELEEVDNKLEQHIERTYKLLFKEINRADSLYKNLRKSRCEEESKIWIKSYFEKNYKLNDEKYLGFEKYLSFN